MFLYVPTSCSRVCCAKLISLSSIKQLLAFYKITKPFPKAAHDNLSGVNKPIPCLISVLHVFTEQVQKLATGWTVRRSNPLGGETRPVWSWGPPSFLHYRYRVTFQEVKRPRRGVNYPPHLAPRLKKEQSYTSTPLLGIHGLFYGELYLSSTPLSLSWSIPL